MVCLDWPEPQFGVDVVQAEVLYVDSFGNAITNVSLDGLLEWLGHSRIMIEVQGREIAGLQSTYGTAARRDGCLSFSSLGSVR